MNPTIDIVRFQEPLPYAEALRLQTERRDAIEQGAKNNALFLLQHPPVITLGRNAHSEHVLMTPKQLERMGIELHEVGRGGDVTYHGPGQLVAYPILNLQLWKPSIGWYLRSLEEVLIQVLRDFDLVGERNEGFTGVWVAGAKIAAIGVGIHNWVTFHGIALNVNPDMAHFRLIVPCGLRDAPITSLSQLLPSPPAMSEVMDRFERRFLEHFTTPPASGC